MFFYTWTLTFVIYFSMTSLMIVMNMCGKLQFRNVANSVVYFLICPAHFPHWVCQNWRNVWFWLNICVEKGSNLLTINWRMFLPSSCICYAWQKYTLVWPGLLNFKGKWVKFNAFLHPNEYPERIYLYLVRQLEAVLVKIGHIFTK